MPPLRKGGELPGADTFQKALVYGASARPRSLACHVRVDLAGDEPAQMLTSTLLMASGHPENLQMTGRWLAETGVAAS
jgi:hypothetical protein